MGVSINWLKEYIDIDWTAEELAHRLTMAGIGIEGVEAADSDVIMDLDLTPNRGDCLGMINLAREVSALNGQPLRIPQVKISENRENINDYIKVEIDAPDLCPRYAARLVKNVEVKPSPEWMQNVLLRSGIRPISNIVDVTNYVMLETNQPLHAFDYDLLGKEKKIVVRKAEYQENFTTLDDVERELDLDSLVITDGIRPVALAGVMGGLNTEISDDTRDVLIESANFLNTNIGRTSKKQGLRSDSSVRFEKGVDPNGVIYAVNRAAQLMQELAGGEVVKGICDVYPGQKDPLIINLRPDRVNYLLGTELRHNEIKGYLEKLKFKVKDRKDYLAVEVPTYRPDISMEVDLIEEVARLYGYNNIPDTLPLGINQGGLTDYQRFRDQIKEVMSSYFYEVINYSFISPQLFDRILLPTDSSLRNVIQIANPLSEEQSVMRTLLLPGILENVSRNMARRNQNLNFFEMGAVYYPSDDRLPDEKLKLGAVVAGRVDLNWLKNQVPMDYYYLKGIVEILFRELGIKDYIFKGQELPGYHPGRTACIICKGQEIGVIGEVHPLVMDNFDISDKACAFELDVETMFKLKGQKTMMEQIAKYPAVERDIAILIGQDVKASEAIAVIKASEPELLQDVIVFDIYTGEQVPEGYKSAAFRLTFQSMERTLKEEDINSLVDAILSSLQEQVQARLR
ncbi:phenylalanyl-trna synthetase beta chain [hydrocarbon metagenome]|uniref:Phenylalanine--tRNA ligase beta subunit n=1 Tax=hydrocarbon metagenome TaxID=938273 RepID=A0A0W8E8P1_9ZZZZ